MVERCIKKLVLSRLLSYPAVSILGPRQAGKTTLAKAISPLYYDFELETDKLRFDLEWEKILSTDIPIVFDEAQHHPEVFPRLRSAIDADRKHNGRFIILGSISPSLTRNVSESLAGRIAICELSPFFIDETNGKQDDGLWLMGGYPDGGILDQGQFPFWQKNYLDLLAMRDLPSWGLSAKPQLTGRLFHMLAVSHGLIWNASQLGKSLGISYHTVNSYLDYLEQAFLIRRIMPFYANIKKRLVKSPKIYWRDTGLLHSLHKVDSFESLLRQPWVGVSWEGWIIEQILIWLNTRGIFFEGPYYLRTADGHELDLILRLTGELWAIEIKLTASPAKSDMDRLNASADLIAAQRRVLISRTSRTVAGKNVLSTNLRGFLNTFGQ